MILRFEPRVAATGFIITVWFEDSQLEIVSEEEIFTSRADMAARVEELTRRLGIG